MSSIFVCTKRACVNNNGPKSPKFKRVSLNKTPEFPSWGLNICVDFDLRELKKNWEYKETE